MNLLKEFLVHYQPSRKKAVENKGSIWRYFSLKELHLQTSSIMIINLEKVAGSFGAQETYQFQPMHIKNKFNFMLEAGIYH